MEKHDILSILMKTNPFELIEIDILEDILDHIEVKKYSNNAYVFRQGDASQDCLFVIASGLAEIIVKNDRGFETVVGLRRSYDFFGETVVLSQQRYPASVRVKDTLTCLLIKRKDLENLIHNHIEFSGFFSTLLAERMRALYEEIVMEQSYEAYSSLESPFFRKRVSEVMSHPVITCKTDDQVTAASVKMSTNDVSALVVLDETNAPRGILTEKNLVKYLIANQMYPIVECTVDKVMSSKLMEISPDAFLGQALVSMIRSKLKHLIVMERNKLVGIISLVDLIKTRSTGSLLLTHDIESQPNLEGLQRVSDEIDNVLNALIAEKAGVREIFEVMSELNERLSRRIIQLSEEQMKKWGSPPVDYCWINMGSAARYEQTLRTDQDNAIIYETPPEGKREEVDAYFAQFAEYVIEGHAQCGFAKCKGNVMATNPKWRRPLDEWIEAIRNWTRSYDLEDTRILTILLDYRPIWGNMALANRLWEEIFKAFEESLTARHMMTKDDMQFQIPISFLGTFITEKDGEHKNQMDIKKTGTTHIANGVRIFAIKNKISEASTFGRIEQLAEIGALAKEDADFISTSFETLMMFRIRENIKRLKQGKEPDNYIDPYSLKKSERMILKDALSGVSHLQKLVNKEFNVVWLRHFV